MKKDRMSLWFVWLGLGVMLSLPACSSPFESGKPMTDYKQNPQPRQRYDITMTIANAPGPFASVEGFVQYDVENDECLPPPNSNLMGYSLRASYLVPFELTRVSETEYIGTIYADMMLDENYHGRGVCHWQLIQTGVELKATGAAGETRFLPSLSLENLIAGKAVTTYFLKVLYPSYPSDPAIQDYPVYGATDLSKMPSYFNDSDLFTITLTAKEAQP